MCVYTIRMNTHIHIYTYTWFHCFFHVTQVHWKSGLKVVLVLAGIKLNFEAGFWICAENSVDNTMMFLLSSVYTESGSSPHTTPPDSWLRVH